VQHISQCSAPTTGWAWCLHSSCWCLLPRVRTFVPVASKMMTSKSLTMTGIQHPVWT
jgi:hypothetical protein